MRPSDDLSDLARSLQERSGANASPMILFLGQELAAAAGVPSMYEIGRNILSDPDLKTQYLRDESLDDRSAVIAAFDEFLGTLTSGQRYRMLLGFYTNIPVPAFYQNLALLIKAGFFTHILTTNIDSLLEQALARAGLVLDRDYATLTLGQTDDPIWKRPAASSDAPSISLIKLHGDLFQHHAAITRYEIDGVLRPQRAFIKGEISGDMIMVGYRLESEPLNEWLAWVPGELWWVAPDALDETLLRRIEASRPVRRVGGDAARPEVFFEQLIWLLIRQPSQQTYYVNVGGAVGVSGGVGASGVTGNIPQAPSAPSQPQNVEEDISDAAYLEGQLQRNRSILLALRQSQTPGELDPQLESQIEYQRRRISELEARKLALTDNRERLLDLLKTVRRSVTAAERDARVDPHAAAYMRKQVTTVQTEYRRELPNQSIVAAAVGATVVLAERLGADIVDPAVIRQLATYAPTSLGSQPL